MDGLSTLAAHGLRLIILTLPLIMLGVELIGSKRRECPSFQVVTLESGNDRSL
jgi:hypothetical protein